MSLAKDFFFKGGFPPCAYYFELKNKLKSLVIPNCFVRLISNSFNRLDKLLNTPICSFSVLALYTFIKMYSESLMETSRIKIRPSLSVYCFLTVNVPVSKQAIKTPQGFNLRKKIAPLESSLHFFRFAVRVSLLHK